MKAIRNILADTIHLFYPHTCTGCGGDLLPKNELLCARCLHQLPHTGFENEKNNPVENIFIGRIPLQAAYSEFYFSKGQLIQHLIHQLKYKKDKEIGFYLGEIMGLHLLKATRFKNLDYLIPLPLYPDKEFKRGYNQAEVICEGIAASLQVPVQSKNIIRHRFTETQTKKHRTERWKNVSGSFAIKDKEKLTRKHILLVDDVITTGATLEACCEILKKIPDLKISIATLAFA